MAVFDPNDCFDNAGYQEKHREERILYACYDLAVCPATFDIVHFLGLADKHREKSGFETMHLVIAPGPEDGFRKDSVTPYDIEEKKWRLNNILIPCGGVFSACSGVSVFDTRKEAAAFERHIARNIFPVGYTVDRPRENYRLKHLMAESDLGGIGAPTTAIRSIEKWKATAAGDRKIITVTLRECSYETPRNSNLDAWGAFARNLDEDQFFPIFIRDMETVQTPVPKALEGMPSFPDVAWNIALRTALYELSYLNLFVNNGPASLSRLNRNSRSLTFKMITPSSQATTEEFFLTNGLIPGEQITAFGVNHWLVWEDDTLESIEREFDAMQRRMKETNNLANSEL